MHAIAAKAETEEADAPAMPRRERALLIAGVGAIALSSWLALPWPLTIASILLGILMLAGAEHDARTLLLPDAVTYGTLGAGLVAAPLLDLTEASPDFGLSIGEALWLSFAAAGLRAAATALLLYALRLAYRRLRGAEGLGLGDIKLAAAIGAWLPAAAIPYCFMLATTAALLFVLAWQRGPSFERGFKLPFGAFLCPALWITFFATAIQR